MIIVILWNHIPMLSFIYFVMFQWCFWCCAQCVVLGWLICTPIRWDIWCIAYYQRLLLLVITGH